MNNRYICKAKRKDNGEWVEGYYARQSNHSCFKSSLKYQHFIYKDICLDFNLGGLEEIEVIPETVGQCTNKTDCKGKFIFSGDLLRFTDSDGEHSIYKVYYSDNYAGWAIQKADCNGVDNMADWEIGREYFEVIGNIHDNPELLEVER